MLVNQIYDTTISYSSTVEKAKRKKIAQFFTPPSVADYMGKLMKIKQKHIRVLDAGAGTGMLGGAICQYAFLSDDIESVHIDFYEMDENVIPFLNQNIELIRVLATEKGKGFSFNIIQENFIMHNETVWQDNYCIREEEKYDVIIGNPPYKKIGKSTEEAEVMSKIVHGQPNLYFLFMAMSVALLKENGEMIYIVPRSFTSGLYFREFRKYFLNNIRLTHLHLFNSRSDVFDSDKILQEAIILRAIKTDEVTTSIYISSSEDMSMDSNFTHQVPYNTVVDMHSKNLFILIPSTVEEIKLLTLVHSWSHNLISLGFQLKTGPVVDFRATDLIRVEQEENTVPLLWANHFLNNQIQHPVNVSKNPQFIIDSPNSKSVLLPSKDYLLIKRFTSKEETRRIQCALYFKEYFENEKIGIENHLNYITKLKGEMTKEELYGLFVLFNSSFIDTYYRILNGSTQVNATEVNAIPLPSLESIKEMGKRVLEENSITTQTCDMLIEDLFIVKDKQKTEHTEGDSQMDKLKEAKEILKSLGMPKQQCNDRSAYVLLALAGVEQDDSWADASINSLRIVDMMDFMAEHYEKVYKPNSRETIRKESIHQFVDGAIAISNVDDDERATNSPKYSYRLTDETLEVIQAYGASEWAEKLGEWLENHETLVEQYAQVREMAMVPVIANDEELHFSPGKHNELQRAIIEEFAPRFAPGAEVLYVGDTKKKDLIKNRNKLKDLGVSITDHDKLPDVVLYVEEKNWLYFIEAVTSVGPISKKRINEIDAMLSDCDCGIVYVTAFLDMSAKNGFKKFIDQIAWETEIWIADNPDHMIHLNGDRFFGPRD